MIVSFVYMAKKKSKKPDLFFLPFRFQYVVELKALALRSKFFPVWLGTCRNPWNTR